MLRGTIAVAGGALVGAYVGLRSSATPGHESAHAPDRSTPSSDPTKKTVYDAPAQEFILRKETLPLQAQIAHVRAALGNARDDLDSSARTSIHNWVEVEQRFGTRVGSLIPKDEALVPGVFIIGIATLSGSILTRQRGIVLRTLGPSVFFLVASRVLLPKTAASFSAYLDDILRQTSPQTAHFLDDTFGRLQAIRGNLSDVDAAARANVDGAVAFATAKMKRASEGNVSQKA